RCREGRRVHARAVFLWRGRSLPQELPFGQGWADKTASVPVAGVIELGGGHLAAADAEAADNQHSVIQQQRGRVTVPGLDHGLRGGPGPAAGVVQLRGGHVLGVVAEDGAWVRSGNRVPTRHEYGAIWQAR